MAVIVALLGAGWLILGESGLLDDLTDGAVLRRHIEAAGLWGPAAVIAFMTLAIVFSPLPSAPIALAAGALYGHGWGTVYVAAGAELGALVAFGLARYCGQGLVRRWTGGDVPALLRRAVGSQNGLMWVVFVSRLLPFISFDLVSYAAGLTPLTVWRFAVATLAGIVPASFLLAHFGSELVAADSGTVWSVALLLGAVTAVPLAWRAWKRHRNGTSGAG